jgi:acetolactate decarboxylase
MPEVKCVLSSGLWNHLQEYSQRTEQPVAHIVSKALADLFEIPYHTMFQVSTATALVEGIYQGAVRVATLREHGLDTFECLDGEMVIIDGHLYIGGSKPITVHRPITSHYRKRRDTLEYSK